MIKSISLVTRIIESIAGSDDPDKFDLLEQIRTEIDLNYPDPVDQIPEIKPLKEFTNEND